MDLVCVDGRYRLREKVGSGSYGEVYRASDLMSGQNVAVKIEPADVASSALEHEHHVLLHLSSISSIPGVHWFGQEARYNVLVFNYLGPSLEEVFNTCQCSFSINTVALIAEQLISSLQYIHARNIVHQDVKPANILIGIGKNTHLALDPRMCAHIAFHHHSPFISTPAFTSPDYEYLRVLAGELHGQSSASQATLPDWLLNTQFSDQMPASTHPLDKAGTASRTVERRS
ncbi:kinase-like protein [Rhizopogon salebrosus TDB-379]|nr:kinase-like protein [Rhizopogon salebrosus TDB-379]